MVNCAVDPDYDGEPECILANDRIFAIFEPVGARMTFCFFQTPDGPAQLVGPISQFLVGLSDPAEWEPSRGAAADPADVPGAFSDTRARWAPYDVTALPGGLQFSTPAAGTRKTFTLTPTGLNARIQAQGTDPYIIQVPMVLRPETRFSPGWGLTYEALVNLEGYTWQIDEDIQVSLTTTDSVSLNTFRDSLSYLGGPEDPNFDYPPGHFIPFPLAIGEIAASGDLEIQIQVDGR
jgi:hypothetical protein